MTQFESKKVAVQQSRKELFEYLSDLNNFKNLLPEEKIEDWQSSAEKCSFKVKGAAKIELEKEDAKPHEEIRLKTGGKTPVAFTMIIHLEDEQDKTGAYLVCEADMNPFMKAMVEKPLHKLFDHIADRLVEINS